MIQRMRYTNIYVPDQDRAIDFYVHKLGFELTGDTQLGNGFRWVTVKPQGQTDLEIVLMKPLAGTRLQSEDIDRIFELTAKGAFGAVFDTADCQKTYDELSACGVEFLSPPKEQFYGIEAMFKDPFGNWFSLTQRK